MGLVKINFKNLLIGFALIIAAFAAFNSALSLNSNSDHVSIRGTEGKVFLWLVNTDGKEKTVALSADLGELNGFFEDDGFVLGGSGSKGTWLHLSAPLCFRGVQRVPVSADVCDANGSCTKLQKTLLVSASPAERCVNYDNGVLVVNGNPFDKGRTYGDGSLVDSTIAYSSYFDPTDFSVEVQGSVLCPKVRPGDSATQKFSILNRGAGSSFDLRIVDYEDGVSGLVSPSKVSLYRGEIEEVGVTVSPQMISGGRRYLSLQVMRGGQIIAEKPVCVDVQDIVESKVSLPARVSGKQCEDITFQGVVENTGTIENAFQLFVPDKASVSPDYLTVSPGEKGVFSITIPANSLQPGKSDFVVTAKTSLHGQAGQATVVVDAASCSLPAPAETSVSQKDNVWSATVGVENSFDSTLNDVWATIVGIPASWTVNSTRVASIAPGDKANVTVALTQNSNEEAASPELVVYSGSTIISRKPLQAIKAAGTTGLFTLTSLSSNALTILLLILLAIAVLMMYGRRGVSAQTQTQLPASGAGSGGYPASYKKRLERILRFTKD